MIDTHTHSHHSPDGAGSIMAMTQAAQDQGLAGIAFTEHAEWYTGDPAYGYFDPDAYFAEVEHVRARFNGATTVLAGVEVGNPHDFPETVMALLDRYPFDLVIGSVHWLNGLPAWQAPAFEQGIEATYRRYFDELSRMVTSAQFDVLGHLDLVRRDSWTLYGQVLDLAPYRDTIDGILQRLVESGRGMEINTSGLRKGLPDPVPGIEIIRRYRELGGELLVFGSDGHHPSHVAYGFATARDLALAAGFTRLVRFERRRPIAWIDL